jgi:hypothetical protein
MPGHPEQFGGWPVTPLGYIFNDEMDGLDRLDLTSRALHFYFSIVYVSLLPIYTDSESWIVHWISI